MSGKNSKVPTVCIYGAGSIGTYVGGRLQAVGADVTFVGRQRIADEIKRHNLTLTDYRDNRVTLTADSLRYSEDPALAAEAELVLLCVKSGASAEAAQQLKSVLRPDAVVVSLQNGISNVDVIRELLPHHTVLRGMVFFNALQRGEGVFHAGTEGALMMEAHPLLEQWLPAFKKAEFDIQLRDDMVEVQWGKLMLNLNNPINALSGLPLRDQFANRYFRKCWALILRETLAILKAGGVRAVSLIPMPIAMMPYVLQLPDWLFVRIARQMVNIDPLARSSMWEDLQGGRRTEVDFLNGEIVRLADGLERQAPVNRRIIELIRDAERGGRRDWTGPELLEQLRSAQRPGRQV